MKKLFVLCLSVFALSPVFAETSTDANALADADSKGAVENLTQKLPVKISGYLQTGWNYTSELSAADGAKAVQSSSFQAKRLRLIADAQVCKNIDFRLQIEAFNGISGSTNGNGQKNIQVMDAFATWKICDAFKLRAGQFYTPLGYENYDISPATLETVDFSNIVYNMACRNAYTYNFVDYGRDLGVMFMGDAFDSGKGFKYFHYDFALTNGSLPCKDDTNNSKDIYASITVRPFKYFNIKGTFNWGEYTLGNVKDNHYKPMTRYVVGAWYNNPTGLDARAEWGNVNSKDNGAQVYKEVGAYVLVGYHVGKFLPLLRYDMYKDYMNQASASMNYNRILAGCTYQLCNNVKIQLNYGYFFYDKDKTGMKNKHQIQLMTLWKF